MKIVIALGGNALGNDPKEQQKLIEKACNNIVPLIKEGHQVVIGHGNGPQVGIINLAFEDSIDNKDIPLMALPECTAMSQGYIGYHIQKGLRTNLKRNNINKKVATLVTQVAVDENDDSFKNLSKPIGPFYSKEQAEILIKASGETYIEDAGRGYRKVVASPKPIEIIEIESIKDLINTDHIVIAGGGGGVPIFKQNESLGANAVIDKDKVAALMAKELNADMLVILTNVKQAQINYGKENAESLGLITIKETKKYIEEGHFAKGSMLPKIEAALSFVEESGNKAIITSLDNLTNALNGIEATIIESR